MSNLKNIELKLYSLLDLKIQSDKWKENGEKIVFTNGCFDLVHRGHIETLANTADLGDRLIVGLNSDSSIKLLKGENRPIIDETSRSLLLASLQFVDAVVFFSDETPYKLIKTLVPDVLAKGGNYKITEIAGHEIVLENGGEVILIPFVDGFSSTNIVEKIKKS